ncbi:Gfo/Idh/MocA family protein [Actinokineospora sp. UTMC 2448]|uniref:Gfo/Idh/MocA family protein n=1 Tax=Actinokineospora sp. UTMC 2448 TaxID=2268449 RepID=UPI0021646131|nr:Gfo/Idh/MocA family oxidoreductase [Actinokineospora sp. UTMC 2448]UVS80466.1 Glucose--fructose oxidoreductase precursor [Actinokineospora sp. UTMC 2448]
MGDLRLGIVGLGAMGAEMLAVAAAHPDFTVPLAADLDDGAVARLAPAHPGVAFGTDPWAVVDAPDLDAVYLATPPSSHAPLAVAALDAGKAVFSEKPLAIGLADGRRMRDAAARAGRANAVNFALSDRHAVLEVERLLHGGGAGTVLGVDIRLAFPRWPRDFQSGAVWLAGRAQGGFLREVVSHFVYLTDRLLGPLRVDQVSTDYPTDGSETAAHGLLRAGETPVRVAAIAGQAGPELYEWVLWGTRRSYLLRDWSELYTSDGGDWRPVPLTGDRGSEHTRLTLFAAAMRGEHPADLADFATALRVQEVVETFHRTD